MFSKKKLPIKNKSRLNNKKCKNIFKNLMEKLKLIYAKKIWDVIDQKCEDVLESFLRLKNDSISFAKATLKNNNIINIEMKKQALIIALIHELIMTTFDVL